MMAGVLVTWLVPKLGTVVELYLSTRDEAWIAMEALKYPCAFVRPIFFEDLVWC